MISLLGVPPPENKLLFLDDPDQGFLADEDYGWVWETPPILCVEDLLLPPVAAAANEFPAMGVPPPPKDRNPSCGRHKEEILRQLRELEFRIEQEALPDHDQTEATLDCWKAERRDFPSTEQPLETIVVEGKALVDGRVPAVVTGVHAPPPPPPDARSKVPAPDRRLVLSRYKEKRKTRRYDKQIRYESRKARAEGRLRIKGRFAKPCI